MSVLPRQADDRAHGAEGQALLDVIIPPDEHSSPATGDALDQPRSIRESSNRTQPSPPLAADVPAPRHTTPELNTFVNNHLQPMLNLLHVVLIPSRHLIRLGNLSTPQNHRNGVFRAFLGGVTTVQKIE